MEIKHSEILFTMADLRNYNSEMPWIEVKETQMDENVLGITIAAIANSCLLEGKNFGYILIGVKDRTWEVVGASKKLSEFYREGGQEVKLYISTLLNPYIEFEFFDNIPLEGKMISVVKVSSATHTPIDFKGETYIRIGSNNKPAKKFPEKLKLLWNLASGFNYEETIVKENVSKESILTLLDYSTYAKIKSWDELMDFEKIIEELLHDGFIQKTDKGYNIKALAALLFAKKLEDFGLERKGVRVILYNGDTKSSIRKQLYGERGYGVGFENLIKTIQTNLPTEERAVDGIMKTFEFYPSAIIRELVANAIIHQDLNIKGSETKIEIFQNRLEITNPGKAVIDILRFYDSNKSRNEKLAYYMRKLNICEELGSGIDRIVEISEKENRFTPKYIATDEYVNVKLFKEKNFDQMTDEDKLNILYYHCCYRYTIEDYMSNLSLRNRFSLDDTKNSVDKISRLISRFKKAGLIKSGPNKTYIPFWAE